MKRLVMTMAIGLGLLGPAAADPEHCQRAIAKGMLKAGKTYLKVQVKCLDLKNRTGQGTCPDGFQVKIDPANQKALDAINKYCTMADVAALGFPADCAFEAATTGVEAQCAALPVTTPTEFGQCLLCWKTAEYAEYIATLFASQANAVCGGSLDETSTVCSDLDCRTPLPDQRDLGDTPENDCQTGIGKAGVNYLLKRINLLEKCALKGIAAGSCLPVYAGVFGDFAQAMRTAITSKCGNRDPLPSPPFCCQCGTANACQVLTREDCANTTGCDVVEGKTCNTGSNTCDPVPGHKNITWWGYCPENDSCPGTALSSLDDLIACVTVSADAIADEIVCRQFKTNGGADFPCPTGTP